MPDRKIMTYRQAIRIAMVPRRNYSNDTDRWMQDRAMSLITGIDFVMSQALIRKTTHQLKKKKDED